MDKRLIFILQVVESTTPEVFYIQDFASRGWTLYDNIIKVITNLAPSPLYSVTYSTPSGNDTVKLSHANIQKILKLFKTPEFKDIEYKLVVNDASNEDSAISLNVLGLNVK